MYMPHSHSPSIHPHVCHCVCFTLSVSTTLIMLKKAPVSESEVDQLADQSVSGHFEAGHACWRANPLHACNTGLARVGWINLLTPNYFWFFIFLIIVCFSNLFSWFFCRKMQLPKKFNPTYFDDLSFELRTYMALKKSRTNESLYKYSIIQLMLNQILLWFYTRLRKCAKVAT